MRMITIEIHQIGARKNELADAVMQGEEVVITHFGEPVAMTLIHPRMHSDPPVWLRAALLDLFEVTLQRLLGHERLPSWLLN